MIARMTPLFAVFVALHLAATVSTVGADQNGTKKCLELCGCPTVSACPTLCGTFEMDKCQPFYQCFLPENGLFGYVKPQGDLSGTITVHIYDDEACTQLRFTGPAPGWEGTCGSDCWGPDTSKIGAGACPVECSASPPKTPSLFAVLLSVALFVPLQRQA